MRVLLRSLEIGVASGLVGEHHIAVIRRIIVEKAGLCAKLFFDELFHSSACIVFPGDAHIFYFPVDNL